MACLRYINTWNWSYSSSIFLIIHMMSYLTDNCVSNWATQASKKHCKVNMPEIIGSTNYYKASNCRYSTEKYCFDPSHWCCNDTSTERPNNLTNDVQKSFQWGRDGEFVSLTLLTNIALPIHEASSSVAEIPPFSWTTEYTNVDILPLKVPITNEDSETTIAQMIFLNRYSS